MNCPINETKTTELLLDFCANKLAVNQTAFVTSHIAGCEACRSFVNAQRSLWSALDTWKPEPVSGDFDRRLYARMEEVDEQRGLFSRIWPPSGWRMAAPIAACAALALAIALKNPSTESVPTQAPAYIESTKVDAIEPEQVERALEDMDMLSQLSTQDL